MSELFRPISAEQLSAWLFDELDGQDSVFGIPRRHFFVPREFDPIRASIFGRPLDTPFGPAAGPHTQMAQNIIAAWLCGARYVELKTVQTLDELDVSKPCIDMEDEGYNVEWSQELRIFQSFDEYLRAWILIHALHHKLGFPGDSPQIVFNLSVGYNREGIRKPNMQWFLDQVRDCSEYKCRIVEEVAKHYPAVRDIDIPDCMSDNVTLSTMHGCPPEEIESISEYLIKDRKLHTLVKLNPTLLGPGRVRTLLNDTLQYRDIVVPDIAFEHDLKYADALPMLRRLRRIANDEGLTFGAKLSNTLEVENVRSVFSRTEKMAYLSGRPLHAITVTLAHCLSDEFAGDLPMSFSAGASCFNAPDLLAGGMQTITVCSDLLKTGGYLRLLDYIESLRTAFEDADASSINEFILKTAHTRSDTVRDAALSNLCNYAERAPLDRDNTKGGFDTSGSKTDRSLGMFDCIRAPCEDECPLHQKVPQYMRATRDGDVRNAQRVIRRDNPIPCILGRACDHLCERACIRTHLDEPVAIRDIKRFAMDAMPDSEPGVCAASSGAKVAIIGAGPGGMAAAAELARGGLNVEIFEQQAYAGGMVGGAVPEYRVPRAIFDRDFAAIEALGVKVHYNVRVGHDLRLSELRARGFEHIVIMVGAQRSKTLSLAGGECDDILDSLEFLRRSREARALEVGHRIGIVGAGDTAMDCARVAWRQSDRDDSVTLIYRRTIDQMPADREEIAQLIEEGIDIMEMSSPNAVVVKDGRLQALNCSRMKFEGDRDTTGRKIPHEIPGSEFDVPLDTLILAISQRAVLDFFDTEPIEVNNKGYIDVDPNTFETAVAGVYAGGDVVNDGPASIVKAAAAGKTIAAGILRRQLQGASTAAKSVVDTAELARRRSQRTRRTRAPQTATDDRRNFKEVMLTYTQEQARAEAARCLDCDTYCSICVGVCPNLALQTYRTEPFVSADGAFEVGQGFQVAVLTDICNECGNCTTFCPSSGAPYRDKPRLYLERSDFEAQADNAFMIFKDGGLWSIDARSHGETFHLELSGEAPSQHPFTEMYVLLKGIQRSVPYLPTVVPAETATFERISHPGYED